MIFMKKCVLTFAMVLLAFVTSSIYGQVGIGTMEPDKSAALDVEWNSAIPLPLGALIPRMSEYDRDKIKDPANGLLIFNTDEDCINVYDAVDSTWTSLCGGVAKSAFEADCGGLSVYGAYVEGMPLNSTNYLTLTVNVTKEGAYTVTATTDNGYGFNASGTFLNKGVQQVTLIGQGKPRATNITPGDTVTLVTNGSVSAVCTSFTIPVLPPIATYTMTCGNATVGGVYQVGVALSSGNTITLPVTVTDVSSGGSWSITTNTVNGISFSGSGTFDSPGNKEVILHGTGAPASVAPANLTLTSNSSGGVATTCNVTVQIAYSKMTIYATCPTSGYGYALEPNSVSRSFVMSPDNFGATPTSTVKTTGLTVNFQSGPTDAAFNAALTTNPPDIVVIGYAWNWSASKIMTLAQYLNKKGVVILLDETAGATEVQGLFNQLYATPINATGAIGYNQQGGATFGPYTLASIPDDPILTGPFQPNGSNTLGGLGWGSDANGASVITGLPSTVIVYSTGYTSATGQGVTMFRDPNLNLFFVGDGGFTSKPNNTYGVHNSVTICPFAVDGAPTFQPIPRTGWTGGGAVYNSYIYGNILAWAINQAQFRGINKY